MTMLSCFSIFKLRQSVILSQISSVKQWIVVFPEDGSAILTMIVGIIPMSPQIVVCKSCLNGLQLLETNFSDTVLRVKLLLTPERRDRNTGSAAIISTL